MHKQNYFRENPQKFHSKWFQYLPLYIYTIFFKGTPTNTGSVD